MKISETDKLKSAEISKDWLWKILCHIHLSPNSIPEKDLNGSISFIQKRESPVEGLGQIYYGLSTKRQAIFRQAIDDTLREKGNEKDAPFGAIEDLVFLIARIKALESVNSLALTVGKGSLGKEHPDILYPTFSVLDYLSPSPLVYEATLYLINSENFDEGYLLEAVKILMECNPQEASSIQEKFKLRLIKFRDEIKKADQVEWDFFLQVKEEAIEYLKRKVPGANLGVLENL